MLVLSLRVGELVGVGNASIHILKITKGRVKIGVAAPREINVKRSGCKKEEPCPPKS